MNDTVKFSSLRCYNCGRKNEEITLGMSIPDSWYYEDINKELGEAKRALCPECFQKIKDEIFKRSLRKSAEEPDNAIQLTVLLELTFLKRDPEQIQLAVSTAISRHYVGLGENPAIDCAHYIAANTCIVRGEAFGCDGCEDYKSINGDEPDDHDLKFTNINRNKDEPDKRYENMCYYYSADGCCDLYGSMSSCEDCSDLQIINEDELDDLKYTDI